MACSTVAEPVSDPEPGIADGGGVKLGNPVGGVEVPGWWVADW
jgi:hypothetical protein